MKWRPIAGLVLRQFYLLRSSPARILPLFAWVAIDIVLWGFMARYMSRVSASGVDFVGPLLGAVLFWDFFIRVMQGVTTAFFEDVWSRNFLNMFAAPLSITQYVLGLVITSLITSAVGLVAMLLLSATAFGFTLLAPGLFVVAAVLVLCLFGTALGIVAAALVLRMGPASEWLIWPIPALLSPFAGVFYPLDTLPTWMQQASKILPPAYVFEELRALIAGQRPTFSGLAVALALAVVETGLALWCFARVHRYALRQGLLARYSAEAVS